MNARITIRNYIIKNVYNQYGKLLTEEERLQLQNQINSQRGLYGESPVDGR